MNDGNEELMIQLMVNYGGMMFFDDDDNGYQREAVVWEKITVNLDEYLLMSNEAFKLHFRMSRDVFEALYTAVGNLLDPDNVVHHDPDYDLGRVLLAVVWILATPDTFRSVALRFGFTPGVLHYHYLQVISALCEISETYIVWPSEEERRILKDVVEQRTGFMGVAGAIDGTHIEVQTPREEPGRYFNRKKDHSIVLQGVSDESLLFRDIYVGEPGAVHDSRVFRRSPLCRSLLENPQNFLNDDEHILGDGAYILTDKVLTPFRDYGNLTAQQLNYNHRHASARVVVERAFGLLKGKWRRLKFLTAVNMEYAVKTVVACVVLHNFIIVEGDGEVMNPNNPAHHVPPQENIELLVDDGLPVDFDHPEIPIQRDHPLMRDARILGVEKRRDIAGRLPQL